jgi:hypothetical protein
MKLSKCVYGVLVFNKENGIGMIKGITNNVPHAQGDVRSEARRAIPLVEWSCGHVCGINAGNIEIYKENFNGVV